MDDDDFETVGDVPMSQPAGVYKAEVSVPIPTLEQVAGEMARQILSGEQYRPDNQRRRIWEAAEAKLNEMIDAAVEAEASSVIADLLAKPIQKTDGYGNAIGEPISLHTIIATTVDGWANELVNEHDGKPKSRDGYGNNPVPRVQYLMKQCASADLQKAVTAEVDRIKAELKAAATQGIARQIAEKVAGMVLK